MRNSHKLLEMFTGIIECFGEITAIIVNGTNKTFWLRSSISSQLKIDESVSHDGVCLTIEEAADGLHKVTAIKETLDKTNLDTRNIGDLVNLERALRMNGRIDGHIVQGHVDTTATCINKKVLEGSNEFTFKFKKKFTSLIIEKGSISINGVSLTIFNANKNKFSVAIIPYTLENTNLTSIEKGATVNIEFDMLGKYVQRALAINSK
ncbi:MAG: riboflavin synthase [Chitinophagaceae bacterium]